MINKKRIEYHIDRWRHDIIEFNDSDIFHIEIPDKFRLGKNVLRLSVDKNSLLKNSSVYIDIVDSSLNSIYYEFSNLVDSNDRRVIIFIYPSTSHGPGSINISGTLMDGRRILLKKSITIDNTRTTNSEILFNLDPVVKINERMESVQTFSGTTRLVDRTNSNGNISILSVRSPRQFEASNLDIEKNIYQTSINTLPTENNENIRITTNVQTIPVYSEYSIINSRGFEFSSSMKGGMIYVNNIDLSYPKNVPISLTSSFLGLSYSASIIEVINTSSISVYPPFRKTYQYSSDEIERFLSLDRFFNHSNFTASYYQYIDIETSAALVSKSFASMDIYNFEPDSGYISRVDISYKPVNSFGDFIPIGTFQITPNRNILTTTGSVQFDNQHGLEEKSIGIFRNGLTDFQNYWSSQSFGTGSLTITSNNTKIKEGIRLSYASTRSISEYSTIKPKNDYRIEAYPGTEYELRFDSFNESDSVFRFSQMDVYISGSCSTMDSGNLNTSNRLTYSPIISASLGEYIGSVTNNDGNFKRNVFKFITKLQGEFLPILVLRTGIWHIGNIQLTVPHENGFNSNHVRLLVPLDNIITDTELLFRLNYFNDYGDRSKTETVINGVYFNSIPAGTDTFTTITQQFGDAFSIKYIKRFLGTVNNNPVNAFTFSFPALLSSNTSTPYTGSNHAVGLSFDINTVIYGYTGSISNPIDTYTWAGTTQGRVIVSKFDNNGQPLLFNIVSISGSALNQLGTFGNGPVSPKTNLDSWFSTNIVYADSIGNLNARYTIVTTSSFDWSITGTSICNIYKYENRY